MLTPSTGEVLRGSAGVMRCAQQQTIAVITICAKHDPCLRLVLTKGEGTVKHNPAVNDSQGGRARDADLHRQQASPSLYVRAATVEMHKVQETKAECEEQDHVDSEPLM